MESHLRKIYCKYIDKLKILKSTFDGEIRFAEKYQIVTSNLPVCLIFNDGKLQDRIEGIIPEERLIDKIESLFN